jgi:nucleoside-diphosphate-sugar epimerase
MDTHNNGKVLVTGGTGKLGSRLVPALIDRGYDVRVLSPDRPMHSSVEWYRQDFINSLAVEDAVSNCNIIVHLAAELWDPRNMESVNYLATRSLAESAERQNVRIFLYTSSVCVYGSPRERYVTERSPVLCTTAGCQDGFYTSAFLREYGRTKLLGEGAIRDCAENVSYIIVRPSNIVTDEDILDVHRWNAITKVWRGYRVTHHIFVDDVVAAIVFLIEGGAATKSGNQRSMVDLYLIANDNDPENTYRSLFRKFYEGTGNAKDRYRCYAPGVLDRIKDVLKFRSFGARYTVGGIRFMPDKLLATGFRYPTGISKAHERAIERAYSKRVT